MPRRVASPSPQHAGDEILGKLDFETEHELLQALPALCKQYSQAEVEKALRHFLSCIAGIGAAFQRAVKGNSFAIAAHIFLQDNSIDAGGQWRPSQHPQGLAIGQRAVKWVPCSGAALGQRHVQRAGLLAQPTIKAIPIYRRISMRWMGIWSADLLR